MTRSVNKSPTIPVRGRGRGGRGGSRTPNQSPNGSPGNRGGFVGPMRGAGGRNSIGAGQGIPGGLAGRGGPSPRSMGGRGAAGPMPGMRGALVRGRGMESPTRGANTPHVGGFNPNFQNASHSFQDSTRSKRWTTGDFSGLSMTNSTDSSDGEAKEGAISVSEKEGIKKVALELMNAQQTFITELQAVIDVRVLFFCEKTILIIFRHFKDL